VKPTVGRTVIYIHAVSDGSLPNGATEYPAIVTQTFPSGDYVNLITFPPFEAPRHVGSRIEGDQPGNWHWPVMTPPAAPAAAKVA
jgi:hypothetical protein